MDKTLRGIIFLIMVLTFILSDSGSLSYTGPDLGQRHLKFSLQQPLN